MQDIFIVEEVSHIAGQQWLIKGIAWQTMQVGEVVRSAVGRSYMITREGDRMYRVLHEPEEGPALYDFKIVAISLYKREIDQLHKGMAGEIVLEGEHGETLLDTKLLVIP
jgi:hypothetical protein